MLKALLSNAYPPSFARRHYRLPTRCLRLAFFNDRNTVAICDGNWQRWIKYTNGAFGSVPYKRFCLLNFTTKNIVNWSLNNSSICTSAYVLYKAICAKCEVSYIRSTYWNASHTHQSAHITDTSVHEHLLNCHFSEQPQTNHQQKEGTTWSGHISIALSDCEYQQLGNHNGFNLLYEQ